MRNGSVEATVILVVILMLALAVLLLIACAKILRKSGQNGWKILIPIYGMYCLYKAAKAEIVFWISLASSILIYIVTLIISAILRSSMNALSYLGTMSTINTLSNVILSISLFVLQCIFARKLAGAFGRGTGFTIGLILLNPIFMMILGFGSARYQYNGQTTVSSYDSSQDSQETNEWSGW